MYETDWNEESGPPNSTDHRRKVRSDKLPQMDFEEDGIRDANCCALKRGVHERLANRTKAATEETPKKSYPEAAKPQRKKLKI